MTILDSARHLTIDSFSTAPTHCRPRREFPAVRKIGTPRPLILALRSTPSDHAPVSFAREIATTQQPPRNVAPGWCVKAASKPVGGVWKRGFDIAVAVSVLVVMAPMMAFVALLILVTMGRPVIFVQQRVGFGGASFRCFKFRSMVVDAQERLARHLAADSEAAQIWRETQKLKHDPRITRLGHILRKTSLDELPQIVNIVRGDMSCIGPRPVLANELLRYGPHAGDYAAARPGLTGMWQVNGRGNTTYAHRVNCDRFYVRRWSLGLDLMILLRTIPAVLRIRETS